MKTSFRSVMMVICTSVFIGGCSSWQLVKEDFSIHTLPSCGINSDKVLYSIKVPKSFVKKNKTDETGYSFYSFQSKGDVFEVSCGSGGAGQKGCGEENTVVQDKFDIAGKVSVGCLERNKGRIILRLTQIESANDFGNKLYFSADMADNLENKSAINNILSSFSFANN